MNQENKNMYIEVVSIEENKQLECISICERNDDCYRIEDLKLGTRSALGLKLSHLYLVIQNTSDENLNIEYSKFTAIDNDGFSYKGCNLNCDYYVKRRSYNIGDYSLPPNSKVHFLVLFQATNISRIIYEDCVFHDFYFSLDIKENTSAETPSIEKLKQELHNKDAQLKRLRDELDKNNKELKYLRENFKEVSEERDMFQQAMRERGGYRSSIKRCQEDMLIKYEVVEDDDYYRIISAETEDTISFNREFDKSKGNHNWINIGDPLIKMRADNTLSMTNGETLIKSPVSGIFEFDNNKLIGYREEICRIRKYPQEMKKEVIDELERLEIKENVYKKERKKMIERETLDELIEEGKIFNIYTKKDGNRTTIPMDVANAVWNRDGGKCCICGSKENLEFDHIIPISKGGATTFRNLQILCKNCNIRKSDNI